MEKQPRRFVISGGTSDIVEKILVDRKRFNSECDALAAKYGFDSYFVAHSDHFSGWMFRGFRKPFSDTDLSKFRKPTKLEVYLPRAKEGKDIQREIWNLKPCKLNALWDELNYYPHPFGGSAGIYSEKKLNDQILFYAYNDSFKGHPDLKELKLSEYYAYNDSFKGHPDLKELKLSEYYAMIGE